MYILCVIIINYFEDFNNELRYNYVLLKCNKFRNIIMFGFWVGSYKQILNGLKVN